MAFFSTPADSRKARDVAETPTDPPRSSAEPPLAETPKASLTVDEGVACFDLRAVVAEGDVAPVEDPELRADVERRWCRKYFDQPERPEFMDLLYEGRPWEWYRVDPSRWIGWDNSKIDLDRLREQRGRTTRASGGAGRPPGRSRDGRQRPGARVTRTGDRTPPPATTPRT